MPHAPGTLGHSSQLSASDRDLSPETIRRIQDWIYLNRKESPLIPEHFYDRLRNKLEREMHDNASSLRRQ
jgi:hypothetical protein